MTNLQVPPKSGFRALLVAQFLGASNDNFLKQILIFMVVNGIWMGQLGEGGQGLVGICFTLPFVLFSCYGGQTADRFNKARVAFVLKLLEIPIALVAAWAFWTMNLEVAMVSLILLTTQSAWFGPSKYALIPELVEERRLTSANGSIQMLTNIAAILASLVGGIVSDLYNPQAKLGAGENEIGILWLPGAVMVGIAVAGALAAFFIRGARAPGKPVAVELNPFAVYLRGFRQMLGTPLFWVAMAWAYFYLVAQLALLMIPEYSDVLEISRTKASYILGTLAISIGIGSVLVGRVAAEKSGIPWVRVGAIVMTVAFGLLGVLPPTFANVMVLLAVAGISAGFYLVPLQAMMQRLSAPEQRGVILGTSNALSFAALLAGSILYHFVRPLLADEPQRVFLLCSGLLAVGIVGFSLKLGKAATRDIEMRS